MDRLNPLIALPLVSIPRVLALCFAYFAFGTVSYSLNYFLPLIVKGWGVSNFLVGWLIAIPEVVGIVAMVTGSWAADYIPDKRWFLVGMMLLCAVGWTGMGFFATSMVALAFVAVIEIGIGIARPMFWTVPPMFLSRAAMAGAIALISVFANFGGIFGPIVIGWLKTTTGSFSGGLYYVAGVTLAASAIFFSLRSVTRMATAPAE